MTQAVGEREVTSPGHVRVAPGDDLVRALEGLLVVLDGPLRPADVATAWGVTEADVVAALHTIRARCVQEARGYRVRATGSGWRLFAADDLHETMRAVVVGNATARLSPAALETLAVVAYRQPTSRSRVAAIRGVNVDAVMRTLSTRGLVADVGVDAVTGATLYATTELFLDLVGLTSLAELPDLAPFLPDVTTVAALEV